jgi:nicotinamidase-related amidase
MQRPQDAALSRDRPFDPARTCLLLIDTQNYVWNPGVAARLSYFDAIIRTAVLPNLQRLVAAFREAGAEVLYTQSRLQAL